ncbi:MAG: proline dehydrogenase family protein [Calditrichaeota bacterium]|nr:proline dehydrogenase family protein [Calditrichota bacterium]
MKLLNRLIVFFMPAVPRFIVKQFAKPYIAGPTLEDAIRVTKELNAQGMCATLDVLGEHITRREEASAAAQAYKQALQAIADHRLDANVSLKLTQMGLKINTDFCYETVAGIVAEAARHGNFVRIDMEDSSCTSDTIAIYLRLREKYDNVGIVLQAYLRRTLADAEQLIKHKANFRLCKGIYVEPHHLAWKDPEIINYNFAYLAELMLRNGCYVGIATHDERLIWHALRIIHTLGLRRDQYEFQMLLGVTEKLRSLLVSEGHRLRVYVPFGQQWYAYSTRRLKENPQIAGYIVRSLFRS